MDLTIVGPEAPLVLVEVVDAFRAEGLKFLGQLKQQHSWKAQKHLPKDFLARHYIPTAEYRNFTEIEPHWRMCVKRRTDCD